MQGRASVIIVVLGALACASCAGESETDVDAGIFGSAVATDRATLESFGFGDGVLGGAVPVADVTPFTVVVYDYTGAQPGAGSDPGLPTDDELDALFRSTSEGSSTVAVADYFLIASRFGQLFDFDYVRTSGGPELGCVSDNAALWANAVQAALATEDRSGYDRDGDGIVEGDEWYLAIISDCRGSGTSIARRVSTMSNGVSYRVNVMPMNLNVSTNVLMHEVVHEMNNDPWLGTSTDRYFGSPNAQSRCDPVWVCYRQTLMGFNGGTVDAVMLDPCHRLGYGWLEPQVIDLANAASNGAELYLYPTDWDLTAPDSLVSILVHDSSRGIAPLEFLMIEARRVDSPLATDAGIDEDGIAIWSCTLDGPGDTIGSLEPVSPSWVNGLGNFGVYTDHQFFLADGTPERNGDGTLRLNGFWDVGTSIPLVWNDGGATHDIRVQSVAGSSASSVVFTARGQVNG